MPEILIGTCSWTDPTLLATDFYPAGINTAEKRLKHYASQFSLVEVDSTYYSMPAERTARLWVERTPSNFTFNIKAFRLFTQHPTKLEALPADLRQAVLPTRKPNLYYRDLPADVRGQLWQRFGEALLPLDSASPSGFTPTTLPKNTWWNVSVNCPSSGWQSNFGTVSGLMKTGDRIHWTFSGRINWLTFASMNHRALSHRCRR